MSRKLFSEIKNDRGIRGDISAKEIAVIRKDILSLFRKEDGWKFRIYRRTEKVYYDSTGQINVHIIAAPIDYEMRGFVRKTFGKSPDVAARYTENPLIDQIEQIIKIRWSSTLNTYGKQYPKFQYAISVGHPDNGFVTVGPVWKEDKIEEFKEKATKTVAISLLRG